MNKKTFVFEVHCKNANETANVINCPNDELFRYDDNYSDLYDYFASYLNDIEDGPHTQFKTDNNNPYSGHNVDGFEEYLYRNQNGIYIQFKVNNGKITDWSWDDTPDEKYKCLEYNDFMFMIKQDIYKSDSIEKIVTSDIVDKYYNKSNTNTTNNKTEDITTKSITVTSDIVDKYYNKSNINITNNKTEDITTKMTPEINFDILFDYGTMIGIGDRFVRKSDISAFVKEECDDSDGYYIVVVLKSGAKLTFNDIDYEDFVTELDKYYRFKGDIFE